MPVSAERVGRGPNVRLVLASNDNEVTAFAEEHVASIREFWSHLGFLLNEVERDERRREEEKEKSDA